MKVYISNYRHHWFSPYKIIEGVFFWTDWSKCGRWTLTQTLEDEKREKSQWVDHPEWVDRWADRLEPVSRAIQWVLDRVHPRVEYVKIDRWDTWSMDSTLSLIILPMLKQLKETKHGVPASFIHNKDGTDRVIEEAEILWNETLDKMIFAFEAIKDDNYIEQFQSGEFDNAKRPGEPGWQGTYKLDRKKLKKYEDRIQEGLELFGKYYRNLWD